ncbi:TIGR02234 family membrane protein [Planotetraspora kaengkrachanensis]|uniref:TIGR02234 family membrane protein n=1 Tax=Planotetraspora kaengkrachanensis TaxID=575193 RepID=A0A8J3LQK6_9ACTN|nr:TIGR02234 family membrane protein [Planotetraspora kaengkrachanensis]GIG76977.1 hypothetical protein Pka01_01040 [Planotetraspora kaengkrachanensis]
MTVQDGTPTPGQARTARRSLTAWLIMCAVGGGLVLLAAGRTWATVTLQSRTGALGPAEVAVTGSEIAASLVPATLAALAAAVAVFATRGLARRAIAVVIGLCGAAVAVTGWTATRSEAIAAAAREHATSAMMSSGTPVSESPVWAWPVLSVAGGLVLLAAGVVAAVWGARWPGMSSRYDRAGGDSRTGPAGEVRRGARPRRVSEERAMWEALDEGADPTADSTADPSADPSADSYPADDSRPRP